MLADFFQQVFVYNVRFMNPDEIRRQFVFQLF